MARERTSHGHRTRTHTESRNSVERFLHITREQPDGNGCSSVITCSRASRSSHRLDLQTYTWKSADRLRLSGTVRPLATGVGLCLSRPGEPVTKTTAMTVVRSAIARGRQNHLMVNQRRETRYVHSKRRPGGLPRAVVRGSALWHVVIWVCAGTEQHRLSGAHCWRADNTIMTRE